MIFYSKYSILSQISVPYLRKTSRLWNRMKYEMKLYLKWIIASITCWFRSCYAAYAAWSCFIVVHNKCSPSRNLHAFSAFTFCFADAPVFYRCACIFSVLSMQILSTRLAMLESNVMKLWNSLKKEWKLILWNTQTFFINSKDEIS